MGRQDHSGPQETVKGVWELWFLPRVKWEALQDLGQRSSHTEKVTLPDWGVVTRLHRSLRRSRGTRYKVLAMSNVRGPGLGPEWREWECWIPELNKIPDTLQRELRKREEILLSGFFCFVSIFLHYWILKLLLLHWATTSVLFKIFIFWQIFGLSKCKPSYHWNNKTGYKYG